MPNLFKDKIFKYVVIGLAAAMLGIFIKEVALKPEEIDLSSVAVTAPEVKIDISLLESIAVENLTIVEKIIMPDGIGRTNPFIPY